jgi:hypothetical protein
VTTAPAGHVRRGSGLIGRAWGNVRSGRSAAGIYGLLIALSVVTALTFKNEPDAGVMAAAVAATSLVFWLAHLHAHLVAEWIRTDTRPTRGRVRREGIDQLPMIVSAAPAWIILILADMGLIATGTAVWTVAVVSLVLLAAWGIALGRAASLGVAGTLTIASINVGMGALIVLLKATVGH